MEIDVTNEGLEEAIGLLRGIKGMGPQAISKALNDTARFVQSDAPKEAAKVFMADGGTIKKRMRVSFASPSKLTATSSRKGPQWTARWFPYAPNTNPGQRGGRAATSRPRRDGGGIILDETARGSSQLSKGFVANLPVRGAGVYRRIVGKKNKDGGPSSLTHAHVVSAAEMLADPGVKSVVQANAQRRLHEALDRQIKELLEKIDKG